jgi:hypothetical protein
MIASGSGATVSTAMAVVMYLEGKKMEEEAMELEKSAAAQRPIYGIPESVQKALSIQQKMALQGMDEQSRQRYIDQITRNQGYAIAGNVDRGAGLQGVAQANMLMNDANANLLVMDNQQKQQNIANYVQGLNNYGQYEDKAFAYNKDAPYQDMAAAIRALKGAGEQAKYAGAQTVANAGSNFAGQAGTAMQTIDTQGKRQQGTYEAVDSPYYTGYGKRGTAVPQMDTINTPNSVSYSSPYVVNTQTTQDPNSVYSAPSQQQWENQNPYNYYVR